MKTKDLRNALKARLASGAIGPGIAWPNVDHPGTKPFFETSFTGIVRTGGGVTGNEILEETGQFSVVVVVETGGGEDVAADYADAVSARFTEGLSIPITGGNIAIIAPAEIRGGFPTETDYRIPVAIRYHALRTS